MRANRAERMTLAMLAGKLKYQTGRPAKHFKHLIRLVQPETVFHWHRDLVRRQWAQESQGKRGCPRIDDQTEHLIVRLAKENPRWGYYKIEGELTKLGFDISPTIVRNILSREETFRNNKKLTEMFDDVFQIKQIRVIHTPIEAPNANSFAERWVRSARQECLDHVLILSEGHLRRVLQTSIEYYNTRRPHQSLEQQAPVPYPELAKSGTVNCRLLLGGIIKDYYRAPGSISLSPLLS